jgi:cyanophycin synthetase
MAEGGTRCRQVEIVPGELAAVRHCMARANPGDLVVLCVDNHATVIGELENITSQAQAGAHSGEVAGDPDMDPRQMQGTAQVSGDQAAAFSEDEAAAPVQDATPAPVQEGTATPVS